MVSYWYPSQVDPSWAVFIASSGGYLGQSCSGELRPDCTPCGCLSLQQRPESAWQGVGRRVDGKQTPCEYIQAATTLLVEMFAPSEMEIVCLWMFCEAVFSKQTHAHVQKHTLSLKKKIWVCVRDLFRFLLLKFIFRLFFTVYNPMTYSFHGSIYFAA